MGSAQDIEIYREMLKLDPSSRVFALLAEDLCASGEWEEVTEVCRNGLTYHPDNLRAQVLLGWALMEMGEVEDSERILSEAVEDFRKNAVIFKFLSEFATFSGNMEIAGEYAKIYEAFQTGAAAPPAPEQPARAETPPPAKSAPAGNGKEAEAVKGKQKPDIKAPAQAPPKAGIEDVLAILTRKIDERLAKKEMPPPLLSEEDKKYLKRELLATLAK